jgi:osmotically-inducible protein OsmY
MANDDRDRERYRSERNRDFDRDRWNRGDEANRGGAGYEGEGFFRGGGRDTERGPDRDFDRGHDYSRGANDFNRGGYWGPASGSDFGQSWNTNRGAQRQPPPYASHRGKGPKNYQRSDERIREDVCELLTRDDRVDATELEVNVNAGVVTLSGSIDDRVAKRRAEDLAESCNGVRDVRNEIRVSRD